MENKELTEVAKRMKQRRIELGYSYEELGQLTGMSKSTLQRYENGGIANVPLDKLSDISSALNVNPEWLLGWKGYEKVYVPTTRVDRKHYVEEDTLRWHIERYTRLTQEAQKRVDQFIDDLLQAPKNLWENISKYGENSKLINDIEKNKKSRSKQEREKE